MSEHDHSFEVEGNNEAQPILANENQNQQENNNENQGNPPKQSYKAYLFISLLQFTQGLPQGFFNVGISLILVSNGASLTSLGIYSWVVIPYFLKIFYAPLMDSYYIKSVGARKTFIIPSLVALIICYVIGSVHVQSYVDAMDIGKLLGLGIMTMFATTTLDVASDGWIITLVDKGYYPEASTFATIGLVIGIFMASNFLIPFNSVEFCNEYIYSEPQDVPLITLSGFLIFMCIVSLLTLVFVFFTPEKPIHNTGKPKVKEIYKLYPKVFTNANLRQVLIWLFFLRFATSFATEPAGALLIQKGFKKETTMNISTMLSPLQFSAAWLAIKIQRKFPKTYLFRITYTISVAFTFVGLVYYQVFDADTNYDQIILAMVICGAFEVHWGFLREQTMESIAYKMAHKSVGSTFITFIHGIRNFSGLWVGSLGLVLGEYINVWILYAFSMIMGALYIVFLHKRLEPLEDKEPEDFGFYLKEEDHHQQSEIEPDPIVFQQNLPEGPRAI